MASDKETHADRMYMGVVAAGAIAITMGLLQIVNWVAQGGPTEGEPMTWLTWGEAFVIAMVLWPGLYFVGWVLNDGLPLLAQRYEDWATA